VLYLATQILDKKDIYAYTFGYRNSLDVKIALQVKDTLGINHILYDFPFENLERYIDDALEFNDGLVFWSGSVVGIGFFKDYLNSSNFKLVNTGQSGDFIFGSFLKGELFLQPDIEKLKSEVICRHISNYSFFQILKSGFPDLWSTFEKSLIFSLEKLVSLRNECCIEKLLENWNLINRQERAIFNSYRIMEYSTRYSSLFYDYKLFNFSYFLPISYRMREKIYIDILKELLPQELSNIPWEKTGSSISSNFLLRKISYLGKKLLPVLLRRLFPGKISSYSMTPFKYLLVKSKVFDEELSDLFNSQSKTISILSLKRNGQTFQNLFSTIHSDIILFRIYHVLKVIQKLNEWRKAE
jgi:asparagine synthetase B (glutamine-hydrolysing)